MRKDWTGRGALAIAEEDDVFRGEDLRRETGEITVA